ncbi:MAG: TolB family protein, partial [Phycisphaerae bacterium]
MNRKLLPCAMTCGLLLGALPLQAELPPLIPRDVLFGNPDKVSPQISPDGTKMTYIAPDNGVLNVYLKTIGKNDDKVITHDTYRGIRSQFWAHNGRNVLYVQDKGGDENYHVYSVDIKTMDVKDLTPFEKVRAMVTAT